MLNGTSKTVAAMAGVITILSYVATAVISAKVALEYVSTVIPGIPVMPLTIALLGLFAILVISGIKDSAKVALGIFSFHVVVLISFLVLGLVFALTHTSFLAANLAHTQDTVAQGGILKALFFGFAASLLGVSGFESSANFVEEQDKGVFRKTLRNMLIGVAIFNPLIALVALNTTSLATIIGAKEFLLADEARILGGLFYQYVVVSDAFLVLSGAVLTAYVGVSGLMYRMSADACLPGFLTKINSRGSYTRIIVCFFLLCTSILLVTKGDLLALAGVYTIAFLTVMSLFALGNLILRQSRSELKRTYKAPLLFVLVALAATLMGIVGNIRLDPKNLQYFASYFIPAALLVLLMVFEDDTMRILLKVTRPIGPLYRFLETRNQDLENGTVIAFVHHVDRLHGILRYISRNETANNIILVHCANNDGEAGDERMKEFYEVLPAIQKSGAFPELHIRMEFLDESFGPRAIKMASSKFKVRTNRVMIGSIHHFHEFDYAELGGVRIIF